MVKTSTDLGLGILTGKVTILKWGSQLAGSHIANQFIEVYNIPYVNIKLKKELMLLLNQLTQKDIENGFIILYGQDVLPLMPKELVNGISLDDLNILKFNHSYKYDSASLNKNDYIINRKRYTLNDVENIVKMKKRENILKKVQKNLVN